VPSASPPAPATTPAPAPAAPAASTPQGYVVQLAAFADDKGANALAAKLKKSGYAAYVEPLQTSRGTLWRVRIGGFGSRPEADAARDKLKGEGQNGIVVPAR
jgi:DedD protein